MLCSEHHLRKQHVDLLCIRAVQRRRGAEVQPNFFSHPILGPGFVKELHHIGLAKYETAMKDSGLVPDGAEGNACQPLDENPGKKHKACEACPRRDLRFWTWRARRRNTSSFYPNPQRLRYLLTRSPRSTSRRSPTRDKAENQARIRVAVAHVCRQKGRQ